MNAFLWLGVSILLTWYVVATAFVGVMHAKKVLASGQNIAFVFKAPLVLTAIIGILADIAFNLSVGTIIYKELPKELLFTARCKRHLNGGSSWRKERATWWCNEMHKFDEGHCE